MLSMVTAMSSLDLAKTMMTASGCKATLVLSATTNSLSFDVNFTDARLFNGAAPPPNFNSSTENKKRIAFNALAVQKK